jgi:drug/metabolite transporter (DMT)-like permease
MKMHFEKFRQLPVFLFVLLLTIDVSVLVMEKFAANTAGGGDGFSLRLLQIPWVWGIAVLSILQLVVWNRILSKTALSVAYPVSSLFFPLTMISAVVLFHEHVTWVAWLGGLLVTLGIGCFSESQAEQLTHEHPTSSLESTEEREKVLASSRR